MKQLSDKELVSTLVRLAHGERALLGEVLRYLKEVEDRDVHLRMAYPSLFDFAQKVLGYSEWESHVRIQAMRLIKVVPGVERKLENGEITLSVVSQAQSAFRREEKKKTPVPPQKQKLIVESLCGTSARDAQKKLAELFPGAPAREKIQFLADGKIKVEFVVDEALWKQLQELFDVRSHVNIDRRWDHLIADMVKLALKKWSPYDRPKESVWTSNEQTRH